SAMTSPYAREPSMDDEPLEPISDEELCAMALAADPDPEVDGDAVPLIEVLGGTRTWLPAWYMATPVAGGAPVRGWRRSVVALVIAAFLVITAFGLCNTYGQLH